MLTHQSQGCLFQKVLLLLTFGAANHLNDTVQPIAFAFGHVPAYVGRQHGDLRFPGESKRSINVLGHQSCQAIPNHARQVPVPGVFGVLAQGFGDAPGRLGLDAAYGGCQIQSYHGRRIIVCQLQESRLQRCGNLKVVRHQLNGPRADVFVGILQPVKANWIVQPADGK